MSGHSLLWVLMLLSCASLVGLVISGILVSRSQKTRAKRDARLAAVTSPRAKTENVVMTAFVRPKQRNRSLSSLLPSIFGFDPNKPEQYPVRWWIILVLTLLVAEVVQTLAARLIGNLSWLVLPVAWVFFCRAIFRWWEMRRKQMLLAQFPDSLAMIVRSVRVGIPVMEAMRTVAREAQAPTGPEFARLGDQISIGVGVEDAVLELSRRCDIPEYRFFATALALQNQTGGTLSETLENLADVIRKRIALVAKGHALAAEAKTSAAVLAALPFVTGAALWLLSPAYFNVLLADSTGQAVLGSAVISLIIGLATIRAMIRKTLS